MFSDSTVFLSGSAAPPSVFMWEPTLQSHDPNPPLPIEIPSVDQTITAVARIQVTVTQTITAKAHILGAPPISSAFGGKPIVIGSAMVSSYQNSGLAVNKLSIYPRRIIWDAPGATGDKVIIQDGSGKNLFVATAKSSLDAQVFNLWSGIVRWKDFIITRIDSGTLYIFFTT